MTSIDDLPLAYEPTEEAPIPPPPTERSGRRVPVWAAWTAWATAIVAVFLAIGAAYGLGMRSVSDERDSAEDALTEAEASLVESADARAETEAALEGAEAQLTECAELAASATALQEAATGFAGDWKELVRLVEVWALTPIGSTEEADAAGAITTQQSEMTPRAGELTATAAHIVPDVSACEGS